MDGFHLDNRVLEARGLLARKGAPETFDGAGFVAAMRRIAAGHEVVMPVFDRARDLAIAGAVVIPAEGPVIVEGNYLAFADPPWDALAELWDLSIRIEEPEEELRRRLVARWLRPVCRGRRPRRGPRATTWRTGGGSRSGRCRWT